MHPGRRDRRPALIALTLPAFRYYPDPIGTGSVVPSDAVCPSCDRARGFAYTGTPYTSAPVEAGYDDEEWQEYFAAMTRDGGPTAYLFQCRHCRQHGGYSDVH